MIQFLLKFLTGGGVSKIVDRLADAYEAKQKAETSKQKITADVAIERLNAQLAAQVKGEASWLPKAVRASWAGLFLVYFGKVILWDKVAGWGSTPDLTDNQWWLVYVIIGFYFIKDVTRK